MHKKRKENSKVHTGISVALRHKQRDGFITTSGSVRVYVLNTTLLLISEGHFILSLQGQTLS